MSVNGVRDELAQMLAGGEKAPAAKVKTAVVKSVGGAKAMCVMAGDDSALTEVSVAGTACKAGDTIAVAGQAGRWYALGVVGDDGSAPAALPAGGAKGALLAKASAKDYDAAWQTLKSVAGVEYDGSTITATSPLLLKQGERNMRVGKNASGATWVKLGAWSGTSDSDTLALEVCTGPGYNGWTNQNVKLEVIVKNGYQATPGATADSGNRNPFAATCVLSHSSAYNGSIKLKVLATSHSDCDVWLYAPFGYSWGDLAVKSSGGEWETLNATQTDEPSGNECPVRVTASSQLYYGNGYWGFTTPDVSGSSENTNDYLRVPSAGIIPYKSGGSSSNLGTSGWPFGNAYMQWAAAYQLFAYQLRLYNSQADAFAQGTAPVVFDCESSVPKLWYNSTTGGLSGSFLATLWSGTWSSGSITVANFAKYNVFLVWQQNMPFPAVCFKNVVNAAATDIEGGACGISTTDTSYSKGLTSHVLIRMTSTTTWEWRGSYIYQMPYSTSTFLRESRNIVKIQGVI